MSNAFWGGFIFCLLSLWLLKHTVQNLLKFEPSKKWPSTGGEVLELQTIQSNVERSKHQHLSLLLKYRYTLGSEKFTSEQVALYTLSRKEVNSLTSQFPVGSTIPVYYNPNKKNDSLLIVGGRSSKKYSDLTMALIGLLIGLLCMAGGYFGILKDA